VSEPRPASPAGSRLPAWLWPAPSWLLGAIVALAAWRVGMGSAGPGIDAGWNAGLEMGLKQGLQWGTEIVFSYGPLGFLAASGVWYTDLAALTFLYTAALYVSFCIGLVWALRRWLPALPSVLLVFFAVALLPLPEQTVVLAVLACMAMLERQRSPRAETAFLLGGAVFAALEALIKLSTGPLVGLLFLIALIGLRLPWWKLVAFVVLSLVGTLLLWLAAGQALGAIPDFLANAWQIVGGYSSAMLREPDVAAWKVVAATIAAVVVAVALVAAAWQGSYRDERGRRAGALLIAVVGFTVLKEGVVRTDAGHLSLYFSTTCLLWIAIPWARARLPWMLAGAALIAAAGLPVRPPGLPAHLDPVANARFAFDQARVLASPSRRADLAGGGQAGMVAVYRLDPATLAALAGHTVAVEPWETAVVWAYGLEWAPLPIFQPYSAYTPKLDRLNSAAVESATGPERILVANGPLVLAEFPGRGVDGRFPGWDPPEQQRAILCNFAPLHTTGRWQVLGRVPDRCGPARPAGSAEASPGEAVPVPVPGPGEVVFARVEGSSPGGLESLQALLLHARTRHAVVNGGHGYRLVPGTAGDGLMLRGDPRVAGAGPFSPFPQAKTIAVAGANQDLRYEFSRMRVRPQP
jgi:hypothetical protein